MAVKLQKYQRQVSPTAETGAVRGDIGGAGAEWGAVGRAAEVVGGLAADFGMKLKKHKDEGDLAGYENEKRVFDQELENRKNQARMQGVTDDQMMEKVVVPAMEEFYADQQRKGFSKNVQGLVDTDWNAQVGIISAREQGKILENAINRSNIEKSEYAKSLEADGLMDEANEVWDGLRATSKPGQVDKWRSESRVGREFITIRQADIDFMAGVIDEKEYAQILGDSNNRVQADTGVLEDDKHRHKIETIGKINNVTRIRAKRRSQSISEFRRLDRAGDVSGEKLEEIERAMGPEYVDTLMDLNYESLRQEAVTDEDSREAIASINRFANGEISFEKAITETKKIKGKAGKRAFWQISEIYKERLDSGVEENTPIKSFRTDYFENVSRFILLDKEGILAEKEGWYDEKMDAFEVWKEKNPDATMKQYYDFRYEQLGEDLASFIGRVPAPQTPRPRVETKDDPLGIL